MTIYYISSSGSDTNNGTSKATTWLHHPWDSASTGISAGTVLSGSDQTLFRSGDVFAGVYLTIDEGGSGVGNEVIVDLYDGEVRPILSNAGGIVVLASGGGDSNVIFQNLNIIGSNLTGVIIALTAINIQILNCDIDNDIGFGVRYLTAANNGIVDSCNINVQGESLGITIRDCSGLIINNNSVTTSENTEHGDTLFNGILLDDGADSNVISNNIIGSVNNAFYFGVRLNSADNNIISGNVISGGQFGRGITSTVADNANGNLVTKNIVSGFISGINWEGTGFENDTIANLVYGYKINGIDYISQADGLRHSFCVGNTIIHSPYGINPIGHGIEIEDGQVFVKNNLVYVPASFDPGSGVGGIHAIALTTGYTSVSLGNNDWFVHPDAIKNGVKVGKHAGTEYNTLAAWQEAITLDVNVGDADVDSISTNPSLSLSGKISNTSVCINKGLSIAGVNEEGQLDIWGKPVFIAPNMGADQGAETFAIIEPTIQSIMKDII